MLDLTGNAPTQSYDLLELAKKTKRAINVGSRDYLQDTEKRTHLGISVIGADCNRATWYDWRWISTEAFDGRQLRLFNRGHMEEYRNTKWLELAGFEIISHQQRVSFGYGDHGGGSSDKIVKAPKWLGVGEATILVEEKTHSKKNFIAIFPEKSEAKCIKQAKEQHWLQMNGYGHLIEGIDLLMYFPVCKDNDEIEPQYHMVDHGVGENFIRRADDIILSQQPPRRAFNKSTHYKCKHFCDHLLACWEQTGATDKNCRSCIHAKPGLNKTWLCGLSADAIIPTEIILKGCLNWKDISLDANHT